MFKGNSIRRGLSFVLPLLLVTMTLFVTAGFRAQTKKPDEQKQGMGVSTGAARSYNSRLTVGVTDPKAAVVFEDVTMRTALAGFNNRSGAREKNYIVETASAGVAIFDYDGDGRLDIYLLNGSTFDAMREREKAPRAALYRNLGNWRFEDVTDKAGVSNDRWAWVSLSAITTMTDGPTSSSVTSVCPVSIATTVLEHSLT